VEYFSNGKIYLALFILSFYSLGLTYIPRLLFIMILMLIQFIIPLFILFYDFNVFFFHISSINSLINFKYPANCNI